MFMELLLKGLYGIGEGIAIIAMSAWNKLYQVEKN